MVKGEDEGVDKDEGDGEGMGVGDGEGKGDEGEGRLSRAVMGNPFVWLPQDYASRHLRVLQGAVTIRYHALNLP